MKKVRIKGENSKSNKWKVINNILNIVLIISLGFLCYSLFLISGIENEIRYIGMGILLLLDLAIIFLLKKITHKEKTWRYILYILIVILFIGIQSVGGYFIYRTYSSLDNINKDTITYKTSVVVLKDSNIKKSSDLKNIKIGIIKDKTSIDGYIIGSEIIKELNLENNCTVIKYEDNNSLMADLYSKKLDAIIISSNYVDMFEDNDEYKKIAEETSVVYNKKKTLTKKEIAKYTGDEILNLNSSNSITEPFTILVMGIDSTEETLSSNASGNGDALMLVTFNPKTLNATILSIPRDSYIPISCMGGIENKITHAAWGGVSCMIKTIQNYFGINIDYYVKINFKGVVKLVDILGGVTVDVPETLDGVCEQNSDRAFGAYVQCFEKGTHVLNGEQALAMARHRKTLLTGDFERGLNQQRVVQGILNQLKELKSANKALELLDAISNNIDTNFTTKQLLSFYDIFQALATTSTTNNIINMQQLYISGAGQSIYDERSGLVLYEFIPNSCSVKEVVDTMKDNLKSHDTLESKEMDFDIEDLFEMTIIGKYASCGTNTFKLLPSVIGMSSSDARSRLISLGLQVQIEEKEITDGSSANGIVLNQSWPAYKRVDKCNGSITLTVAKVIEKVVEKTDDDKKEDNSENNSGNNNENNGETNDNNGTGSGSGSEESDNSSNEQSNE